ncbi:MAG TPA: polysaccharide biosynthesis/export family protein [Sphingobacteriaceae bacterium]
MNFKPYRKIALYACSLLLFTSCSTQKDLVYFSDLDNGQRFELAVPQKTEPQIQPNDMLSITVSTLSPESNVLFSGGANVSRVSNNSSYPSASGTAANGYVVDKNGFINFPVLGQVKVGGLTKDDVREKLTADISKYVKSPIVNVAFENFKVTVIGEVNRPSTFTVNNDNINLLEALGLAGDMTVYGKRENVLIIREQNGKRTMNRVNLNRKDVLNSPFFYLKQNDIVYVEPDKSKGAQISTGRQVLPYIVSAASIITIVVSRLL